MTSFVFSSGAYGQGKWREYRSNTLIITSNLPRRPVKDLVQRLEYMQSHVSSYLHLDSAKPLVPLNLYLTQSIRQVKKSTGAKNISGIYISSLDGIRAAALGSFNKFSWQLDYKTISAHEYVHYLIDQKYKHALPKWYAEGLADFLSTGYYQKKSMVIGHVLKARIRILEEQYTRIPISVIFEDESYPDLHKNYQPKDNVHYAMSWLLVHMLHMDDQYSSGLDQFVSLLSKGVKTEEALLTAFSMTISDINIALRKHYKRIHLQSKKIFRSNLKSNAVRVISIEPEMQTVMNWKILVDFAHEPTDFAYISEKMEKINQGPYKLNFSFQEVLLSAYAGSNNYQAALNILQSLSNTKRNKLKYDPLKIQLTLLSKVYDKYQKDTPYNIDTMKEIRRELTALARQNPNDPKIHYLYGLSELLEEKTGNAQAALKALERAHFLIPNNTQVQYMLARAALNLGHTDKACALFNHIAIARTAALYTRLANERKNEMKQCS